MARNIWDKVPALPSRPMKPFSRKERKIRGKLLFLLGLGTLGLIAATLVVLFYFCWSLRFDLKQVGQIPERSWIYDMDGKLYTRLYGENRILIEPDKVS